MNMPVRAIQKLGTMLALNGFVLDLFSAEGALFIGL
jgi:hypothetical protein